MAITIAGGKHSYELAYTLPEVTANERQVMSVINARSVS